MNLMLGFAAGVMIAASFWSLLQPAIERADEYLDTPAYLIVGLGFLCGAVFMWLSDKAVTYTRKRVSCINVARSERTNRMILLILSITLHNIPEGLAVGVAFGALNSNDSAESLMGAITIAVGIGLQNFPEGAAVSLPLRREGASRKKSFFCRSALRHGRTDCRCYRSCNGSLYPDNTSLCSCFCCRSNDTRSSS